jgi:hypothetical protein
MAKQREVEIPDKEAKEEAPPKPVRVPGSHLADDGSDVCPGCGGRLDFWACEAICHDCGFKFTCDG